MPFYEHRLGLDNFSWWNPQSLDFSARPYAIFAVGCCCMRFFGGASVLWVNREAVRTHGIPSILQLVNFVWRSGGSACCQYSYYIHFIIYFSMRVTDRQKNQRSIHPEWAVGQAGWHLRPCSLAMRCAGWTAWWHTTAWGWRPLGQTGPSEKRYQSLARRDNACASRWCERKPP